jgi:hypothetical protein
MAERPTHLGALGELRWVVGCGRQSKRGGNKCIPSQTETSPAFLWCSITKQCAGNSPYPTRHFVPLVPFIILR